MCPHKYIRSLPWHGNLSLLCPLHSWVRNGTTSKEQSNQLSNLTIRFIVYFLYTKKRTESILYQQHLILGIMMQSIFSLDYPGRLGFPDWWRNQIMNVFWQYQPPLSRSHSHQDKSKDWFFFSCGERSSTYYDHPWRRHHFLYLFICG